MDARSRVRLRSATASVLRGLTFELTGSQRQDARPDERMICPAAGRAWWPAVGAPVERGVRQRRALPAMAWLMGKLCCSGLHATATSRSALRMFAVSVSKLPPTSGGWLQKVGGRPMD